MLNHLLIFVVVDDVLVCVCVAPVSTQNHTADAGTGHALPRPLLPSRVSAPRGVVFSRQSAINTSLWWIGRGKQDRVKQKLKLHCDTRFQPAFTECGYIFKKIMFVGSNQSNYFKSTTACSKRRLKMRVAMHLYWYWCVLCLDNVKPNVVQGSNFETDH